MDWGTIIGLWPFVLGLMVTGVVSGVAAGLLGVGGGAVIVPALATALAWLGYDTDVVMHVAVGTSLAIIIPTGLMSARSHYRRGALDLETLKLWVPFIVAGTLLGGLMAGLFSGNVLRIVFAVMAFVIAINIVFSFQTKLMGHLHGSKTTHRISAFVVGYISALMGIGGGSLSVPTQVAFGAPIHRAVGTSAALGVAIAVSGTIGFIISGWAVADTPPFSIGYVNLIALVLVGVLAATFAPVGATLAHRLEQKTLKYVFAGFLVLVGLNMLWKVMAG
ncbi:sulfite exporter TauE/SafE family protein [Devosia algicola]|uniref:Probable membrane transporter protein n=1 Tax=Devosia algicola TaxID=3026418 RepID=A0ABY7YS17_9HYPH|nr:sulfite exporter TauE/SafE family protein [Devosia algicola]WDR03982.1 sulfite exporter TauE/SafE family protein [Devosia algicola]